VNHLLQLQHMMPQTRGGGVRGAVRSQPPPHVAAMLMEIEIEIVSDRASASVARQCQEVPVCQAPLLLATAASSDTVGSGYAQRQCQAIKQDRAAVLNTTEIEQRSGLYKV
jgi:hypothetical protein